MRSSNLSPSSLMLPSPAPGRRFFLSGSAPDQARYVLTGEIHLAEGQKESWETITRTVQFEDPFYGEVIINRRMLEEMAANFAENVYGQEIAVDVAHAPEAGAAGFIRALSIDGDRLRGRIEWTPYGMDAVNNRGFRYFSADYTERYKDPESGTTHGALLFGAGLTTRPRVKRLDPVNPERLQLSFDGESAQIAVPPVLFSHFTREAGNAMNWFDELKKRLAARKLAEPLVNQLLGQARSISERLGGEEEALTELADQFDEIARQLAERIGEQAVTLQVEIPDFRGRDGLHEDDVKRLLAEQRALEEQETKRLAEDIESRRKQFRDQVAQEEGLTEMVRKKLSAKAEELITSGMADKQVKLLADFAIEQAHEQVAASKLAAMGYGAAPAGIVHLQADESNAAIRLQELISKNLRGTAAHEIGSLRLPEKVSGFARRVLAEFDRIHLPRLLAEEKRLAAGTTGTGDTDLPVGFQRTVILEALSDLNVLQLVQTLTDFQATATTQIPYEQRDASAVLNDGVVYEAQGIHRASVTQAMDLAYILPMKLAFLISNEVMHFSRTSGIDWDAYARNVESNTRVIRELIARRICNELQRAADATGATEVTAEDVSGQLAGATSTIKTANFPIVRMHQARDLQGNAIGNPENPIVVVVNDVTIEEYDGSGNQTAGTYYRVTNYNLGYIQLVDETGAPVTPTAAGACTVSYWTATNVALFDLDTGGDLDLHLNGLLRAIGAQKAMLSADRFVMPTFLLMSPVLNDTCTNARNFEYSYRREGSALDAMGDLERIKGIPAWSTNAPGVDLGDERILMGPRGLIAYAIAKPWMTGQPFEAIDANGLPTGQKQAYGEEYNAIHVPSPVRNRLTSVIAYSATGR